MRTSCTKDEANLVIVETRHSCYKNDIQFAWPSEQVAVSNLERMLETAYEAGQSDARRSVRQALGLS